MTKKDFEIIQDYFLGVSERLLEDDNAQILSKLCGKLAMTWCNTDPNKAGVMLLDCIKCFNDEIARVNYNRGLYDGVQNGLKIMSKAKRFEGSEYREADDFNSTIKEAANDHE
jgi:hypothetical protein